MRQFLVDLAKLTVGLVLLAIAGIILEPYFEPRCCPRCGGPLGRTCCYTPHGAFCSEWCCDVFMRSIGK